MFTIDYEVRSTDVDVNKKMKLSSVFRLFQETATMHYESIGLGRNAIIDKGLIWILSRLYTTIDALPCYGDHIQITTIPGEVMHSLVPRYFLITKEHSVLIQASSIWALLNFTNRKILDPVSEGVSMPSESIPSGIEQFPPAIKNEPGPVSFTKCVSYSDLDLNGHMNNTRYIDMVSDILNKDVLFTGTIQSCNICYFKEAKFKDKIMIHYHKRDQILKVEGKNNAQEKIFACEIHYS